VPVKHSKTLAIPDNGNAGQVQSADWNGDHDLSGMLALLDALSGQANKVLTFDAGGNPELLPKASILSGVSPAFTGIPTAPTASPGTSNDQLATTAFTQAAVAALVAAAPGLLNTLDELAQALGDDPAFATTITSLLSLKAPLASPAFTGNPTAPDQAALNNSLRIANTKYVEAAVAAGVFAGSVIGSILTPYVDNTTLTALIPVDDTPPLIGEGTQILTQNFTPKSVLNKLRCTFRGTVGAVAADNVIASIFAGSVNIGSQSIGISVANGTMSFMICAEYTPGVLTAQTISVRAGGSTQNIAFNGIVGQRRLGGSQAATLLIEEIKG
jgi:hypothetical protein